MESLVSRSIPGILLATTISLLPMHDPIAEAREGVNQTLVEDEAANTTREGHFREQIENAGYDDVVAITCPTDTICEAEIKDSHFDNTEIKIVYDSSRGEQAWIHNIDNDVRMKHYISLSNIGWHSEFEYGKEYIVLYRAHPIPADDRKCTFPILRDVYIKNPELDALRHQTIVINTNTLTSADTILYSDFLYGPIHLEKFTNIYDGDLYKYINTWLIGFHCK